MKIIPLFITKAVSNLDSVSVYSKHLGATAMRLAAWLAWLAQLVERQTAVREVEGSSPRPDQHSGS